MPTYTDNRLWVNEFYDHPILYPGHDTLYYSDYLCIGSCSTCLRTAVDNHTVFTARWVLDLSGVEGSMENPIYQYTWFDGTPPIRNLLEDMRTYTKEQLLARVWTPEWEQAMSQAREGSVATYVPPPRPPDITADLWGVSELQQESRSQEDFIRDREREYLIATGQLPTRFERILKGGS